MTPKYMWGGTVVHVHTLSPGPSADSLWCSCVEEELERVGVWVLLLFLWTQTEAAMRSAILIFQFLSIQRYLFMPKYIETRGSKLYFCGVELPGLHSQGYSCSGKAPFTVEALFRLFPSKGEGQKWSELQEGSVCTLSISWAWNAVLAKTSCI